MTKDQIAHVQRRLAELGLYTGGIDGIAGPKTDAAIRAFQRLNGLVSDGIVGPKTSAELFDSNALPIRNYVPPFPAPIAAQTWPRQKDVPGFFGEAGSPAATAGKVVLPIKFRLAWDLDQSIGSFKCHEKVAAPFASIWNQTVQHYGEQRFRALRLDLYGGCYNNRPMRNGTRKSMHAYGIAYDVDPEHNQLKWTRDRATLDDAAYDPFWRIVESTGAVSLGRVANYDWMHFQFARL